MPATLDASGDRFALHFERRLEHPPDRVWAALTDPADVSAWFPADIDGVWVVGAVLRFPFRHGQGPTLGGVVLEVDPPRRLAFTWNDETLAFDLEADGDGTMLRFTNTFDDGGKAARGAAGWDVCLAALERRLAGAPPAEDGWREAYEGYATAFGPEHATAALPD